MLNIVIARGGEGAFGGDIEISTNSSIFIWGSRQMVDLRIGSSTSRPYSSRHVSWCSEDLLGVENGGEVEMCSPVAALCPNPPR